MRFFPKSKPTRMVYARPSVAPASRSRSGAGRITKSPSLTSVNDWRGSWYPWIREPYPGAWQRNDEWTTDTVLAHPVVYACVSRIMTDVGKLTPTLKELGDDGIWSDAGQSPFAAVLATPNHFQNHIQFKEWWIASKLLRGNAYALKQREPERGLVRALYLLDPSRVTPLIAPSGAVYYQIGRDNLSGLEDDNLTVPASEIIHDRMNCLFHPLVGTSPIFACGVAANLGLKIQTNSVAFFGNGSNPSGILVSPTSISAELADQYQERWMRGFSGEHSGRVAVIGGGMTFTPLRMTAIDAQLVEQLNWAAGTICSVFHMPLFKAQIGDLPGDQNIENLNQIYYSDCLQSHIESWELAMDTGLELENAERSLGVELDLDGLLRMDAATQMEVLVKGSGGAVLTPNEARWKVDKSPLEGGDTLYRQQQDFSMEALAERDRNKPFAKPQIPTAPPVGASAETREPVQKRIPTRAIVKAMAKASRDVFTKAAVA